LKPQVARRSQAGGSEATGPGLSLAAVTAGYRRLDALREVSLTVGEGEAVGLLGANGAGKTTLLRTISGEIAVRRGTVTFDGRRITSLPPERTLRAGIAHVLQGRHVFADMTVRENLELGAIARGRRDRSETLGIVYDEFPMLAQASSQRAGNLSGGQQQMLVIARAVMSRPKLLLLDEPSLGLAPVMFPAIANVINWVRQRLAASVLLVEQNSPLALSIVSRAYILASGRVVYHGTSEDIKNTTALETAYLGATGENGRADRAPADQTASPPGRRAGPAVRG
jgi:branched-chain amino acid transport system ATP-binding protein